MIFLATTPKISPTKISNQKHFAISGLSSQNAPYLAMTSTDLKQDLQSRNCLSGDSRMNSRRKICANISHASETSLRWSSSPTRKPARSAVLASWNSMTTIQWTKLSVSTVNVMNRMRLQSQLRSYRNTLIENGVHVLLKKPHHRLIMFVI